MVADCPGRNSERLMVPPMFVKLKTDIKIDGRRVVGQWKNDYRFQIQKKERILLDEGQTFVYHC